MRDLEIRGAGNLLGAEQSGHMESVGYDLYCKMLNEAVKSMKGEFTEEETFETTVDMDMDAYIPATYIKNEIQKLDIYKRIAEIENEEELMDMQEELMDRFGDLPVAVNNLLNIALLKSVCHSVYITNLVHKENEVKLVMYPKAKLAVDKFPELLTKHQNNLRLITQAIPYFVYKLPLNPKGKTDTIAIFENLKKLLEDFKRLL
jgi:transcription-repair coupling factor (superfamily II helicase)